MFLGQPESSQIRWVSLSWHSHIHLLSGVWSQQQICMRLPGHIPSHLGMKTFLGKPSGEFCTNTGHYFGKYKLICLTLTLYNYQLSTKHCCFALWQCDWQVWRSGMITAMQNYFNLHTGIWVLCREGLCRGVVRSEPILSSKLRPALQNFSVRDTGPAATQTKQGNVLESKNCVSRNIKFYIEKK